ncbi:Bystin-domain-containing protein [Stereum hirsutum FP-91666 SS1]|uniref:Bystin-domain-containing protein n=1 Tax=Stereum hirsutum (strain FP-91666) TaxID=721885 RepID=UPI000440DA26|nr:Bystin-domain-containing protein [Stereum hirsutum FP-91666 SS1]EIM88145.1 Bystin-domain-containing protein [Stereum hirsutum FP-91666 SS1]
MPRATKPSGKSRHDPLHVQLRQDEVTAKYGKVSNPTKRSKASKRSHGDEENDEVILDPKTSKRIFELARDQQEELQEQPDDDDTFEDEFTRPRMNDLEDEDEDEVTEEYEGFLDLDHEEHELQIDSGDIRALDSLLPSNAGERKTLADLIFAKLDAAPTGSNTAVINSSHEDPAEGLDPKVVEVYQKVGLLLQSYRSGPLPKPFKIVPSLPAWARILALTSPEKWSPQACHAATRIFISNMKPPQARVFLEGVVLGAIREDIANPINKGKKDNRKLHVHYYDALKRALYKPAAFFKGIVFPMLDSGCTLKEAAIVASVLAKVKVPLLHSSAALLRIASMEYTGPNSLFIRVLLDKKHALPYKVIDGLVFHFIRLSNTHKHPTSSSTISHARAPEKLPVLWHQSLLVFCQRYAADMTPDQKDALLDVARVHPHPQISPEVRRELVASVARGEAVVPVGGEAMDLS